MHPVSAMGFVESSARSRVAIAVGLLRGLIRLTVVVFVGRIVSVVAILRRPLKSWCVVLTSNQQGHVVRLRSFFRIALLAHCRFFITLWVVGFAAILGIVV